MTSLMKNKRKFFRNIGIGLSYFLLSNILLKKSLKAKKRPKVVIIGSGIGGASCLKYMNKFSNEIDIKVVESKKKIRTCPFSNLVIGNILEYKEIVFEIDKRKYSNVQFIYENVNFVDSEKKLIKLSNNIILNFDYLILSPGIGYKDNIQGYNLSDEKIVPHCWDGSGRILDFKKRIDDLESDSKIIISSPDYPYRCPPAPYERASLIANYLKKKKKKCKILILDSKDSFTKQENFFYEWGLNFKDTIEWIPRKKGGKVVFFNSQDNLVKTENGETFKGDFIHIIPEQKTSRLISDSRLIDDQSDWCQINPVTFELIGQKDIYVLGDSINAWDMPKSAFSANSQAKVLSINLINKIFEKKFIEPVFLNTCYSFSSEIRAFSISSWYRLNKDKDKIVSLGSIQSDVNASPEERVEEVRHAFGWYETMVNSLF